MVLSGLGAGGGSPTPGTLGSPQQLTPISGELTSVVTIVIGQGLQTSRVESGTEVPLPLTVTATYDPANLTQFEASSAEALVTINPAVFLTSSPNPSSAPPGGTPQAVTFTATVNAVTYDTDWDTGASTPMGTVNFLEQVTNAGSGPSLTGTLSPGSASAGDLMSTAGLSVGQSVSAPNHLRDLASSTVITAVNPQPGSLVGNVSASGTTIDQLPSTTGLYVGEFVSNPADLLPGTTITAINATSVTLSNASINPTVDVVSGGDFRGWGEGVVV